MTVINNKACLIPSSEFLLAPYSLMWGDSIYAVVKARNIKGWSEYSAAGSGALIFTVPDAPINVRNVPTLTDADTIGLLWDLGSESGGTPVIDYTISYNGGAGDVFTVLESNIVLLPYEAHSLTVGTIYRFKVQSRNAHGISDYSSDISVLAA